jgi:pentapeptide repeat protein
VIPRRAPMSKTIFANPFLSFLAVPRCRFQRGLSCWDRKGDDKIIIRLGGIYALEGVMKTSEPYRQPVLETLCAFVRDRTITKKATEPLAADIQAALTVIRRRKSGEGVIDLSGSRISHAQLSGANLSGSNLSNTTLSSADLRHAELSGADLGWCAPKLH